MNKEIIILGIRGIPASHGGFETFAEFLCLYLVKNNWNVVVYCQEDGSGKLFTSDWEGVTRIHIPVKQEGPLGTIIFDLKSVIHSLRFKGVFLTLGYNTAIFNFFHRVFFKKNVINMDGIEWRRQKWGKVAKFWFWMNERFGCWFGSHLVADHPKISEHLSRVVNSRKITMIPYGAPKLDSADDQVLRNYNLEAGNYAIVIARAEPENSLLEIVTAFSKKRRDANLVVLGNYQPESNSYHQSVFNAASEEVLFLGAIYDPEIVRSLRFHCKFYIHGHQVGGTNPSLVEALGAGNAVLAHDNPFNRWVAGNAGCYFYDIPTADRLMTELFSRDTLIADLRQNARVIHSDKFLWEDILAQYESLLLRWLPKP